MTSIIRRQWAVTLATVSGLMITAGTVRGQDIQGDIWQFQRDQRQAARDIGRLQYDIATGNSWAAQRDLRNIQRDQQNLYVDQQNLREDTLLLPRPCPSAGVGYPTNPYPTPYSYPQPAYRPPTSFGALPYGGSPYGGGFVTAPLRRPW